MQRPDPPAARRSWRDDHQRDDGSYDAETWGEVDANGELVAPDPPAAPRHGNTVFHVRRQAQAALTLATRRTGKLGGWSRESRDPNVLRRELEVLARNALLVCDHLEASGG